MRRAASPLVAMLVAVLVVGCADDGRTLRAPTAEQTLPPSTSSSTAGSGPAVGSNDSDTVGGMTISSPAFTAGGALPDVYTCQGTSESPPLEWTGVPLDAVELGIVVTDADANGYVHWAVAGLDPALIGLAQNRLPEGAIVAKNSDGTVGWLAPCPPGEFVHRYSFTIYALSQPSGLSEGADALQAAATIAGLGEARATITALYPAP